MSSAAPPSRLGLILKASVLATGCAGIVAEFVLSTLATYLIGNAVFQWTMVMSLMLFAMGLGSRVSKSLRHNLLDAFILVEFALSLLCAASAALAYGLSAFTEQVSTVIYIQALLIGGLIGCEIPLVTRLNQSYEELRTNIAAVLEKDYFGSLVGGLLFAFVGLPYLGLTYTPIALGAVNFLVAAALLIGFFRLTVRRRVLVASLIVCALGLGALAIYAQPIVTFGEQSSYRDKVIFAEQTRYQKIVITRWRDDYWLFINGKEQFSTMDEHLYHEPLVHPAVMLSADPGRVLILGGGDGLALREVLKHRRVRSVTLVDLDPAMTRLAAEHPVLARINRGSMRDGRVRVVNQDARAFLRKDRNLYGVIIVDLPDPASFELMHLYSLGFYRLAASHLQAGGVLVTQAGSPYFANRAFLCILKTMGAAGFSTLAYHNDIPTMGQWGWVLGVRASEMDPAELKKRAASLDLGRAPNRFLNREAMTSMIHFGKGALDPAKLAEVEVNTEFKPVLQRYYAQGLWDAY